ncbi:hypothetical protein G4G28_16455 [Massilia sp. Dwa41.01b]|uniref:hypothetical protein n=1 Tax=Massilia sp. Dwa41.01b TaxID=2709302 RepID=UPI001601F7CC|nr:hypothetical protein [Massilia sp. Dwa41.01b]QNA89661.1 hypothetical protein G4G28_16455 [Massilia sp. Dwa41.01b]
MPRRPKACAPGCLAATSRGGHRLPACRGLALGVEAAQVAALYPLPPQERPARTILLYGPHGKLPFAPSSHELPQPDPPGATPPRRPQPMGANLLADARIRPFGVEERVRVEQADGRLRLQCAAGTRAAGVLVDGPWTLSRANVLLVASYAATGVFSVQAADAASAAREASHPRANWPPKASRRAQLALPAALDRASWRQFVILCPQEEATLVLDTLALEAQPAAAVASRSSPDLGARRLARRCRGPAGLGRARKDQGIVHRRYPRRRAGTRACAPGRIRPPRRARRHRGDGRRRRPAHGAAQPSRRHRRPRPRLRRLQPRRRAGRTAARDAVRYRTLPARRRRAGTAGPRPRLPRHGTRAA